MNIPRFSYVQIVPTDHRRMALRPLRDRYMEARINTARAWGLIRGMFTVKALLAPSFYATGAKLLLAGLWIAFSERVEASS